MFSDMGHTLSLNSICDIEEYKQQKHATLPFLKIDMRHWEPPIKGPPCLTVFMLLIATLSMSCSVRLWPPVCARHQSMRPVWYRTCTVHRLQSLQRRDGRLHWPCYWHPCWRCRLPPPPCGKTFFEQGFLC